MERNPIFLKRLAEDLLANAIVELIEEHRLLQYPSVANMKDCPIPYPL
jgi:hypothetical protein